MTILIPYKSLIFGHQTFDCSVKSKGPSLQTLQPGRNCTTHDSEPPGSMPQSGARGKKLGVDVALHI